MIEHAELGAETVVNPNIRLMRERDSAAALHLCSQNGWNQRARDWQRQLDLEPEGCFVAELEGRFVGTACACVFQTVAWVNLVLVDQAHRGRGIGTSLMRWVLAYLDQRGVSSIRLDATPLGRPIYEKLGFHVDHELMRYAGTANDIPSEPAEVSIAGPDDLPAMIALDRRITGTPRGRLIEYIQSHQLDPLLISRRADEVMGYASYRPGMRAWQIGPCLGPAVGCRALLTAIVKRLRHQPIVLDVPILHAQANEFAAALMLAPQRRLTRMTRGVPVHERIEQHWCSFGPEKG